MGKAVESVDPTYLETLVVAGAGMASEEHVEGFVEGFISAKEALSDGLQSDI